MMGRMLRALTVTGLLALAGCSATRPLVSPQPWDTHGGETLQVRGASAESPGKVIYRTLRDHPSLRRLLEREGEPDTLEVQGGRLSAKTIILRYTRPSAGQPRVLVLVPSGDGFVARGPLPIETPRPAKRRSARRRPSTPRPTPGIEEKSEPATEREEKGRVRDDDRAPDVDRARDDARDDRRGHEDHAGKPQPSAEQALGCPIDPSRPDCQEFCTAGADHEWCDH